MHAALLSLCVLSHLLQWFHRMDSTQNLLHQQQVLFPTAMSLFLQASLGKQREGGGQGRTEWQTQRKSVKGQSVGERGGRDGKLGDNMLVRAYCSSAFNPHLKPTAKSNKP